MPLFSVADEPTVQGVRRARGRLPFWRLHLRGLQGESSFHNLITDTPDFHGNSTTDPIKVARQAARCNRLL